MHPTIILAAYSPWLTAQGTGSVVAPVVLLDDLLPLIEVLPVDPGLHVAARAGYRAWLPSDTSFVDQASFGVIEREAIETAFALDADLTAVGVTVVPHA